MGNDNTIGTKLSMAIHLLVVTVNYGIIVKGSRGCLPTTNKSQWNVEY